MRTDHEGADRSEIRRASQLLLRSRRALILAFSGGSAILGGLFLPLFVFDAFKVAGVVSLPALVLLIGVGTMAQALVYVWVRSGRGLEAAGAAASGIQALTCIGASFVVRSDGMLSLAALMFTVVPLMLAGSVLTPARFRIAAVLIHAGMLSASAVLFAWYGWTIVIAPLTVLAAGAFIIYANGRVAHDLSIREGQHHTEETRLEHEASTDPLTGLLNRRGFLVAAESQLKLARRQGAGVTLVYLDLDGMKQINDSRGHSYGDDVLRRAAALLRGVLRESDLIGRVGGDEFVVFAWQDLMPFPKQLDDAMNRHNAEDALRPSVRLSYGVAYAPPSDQRSLDELMSEADDRMYAARREGRTPRC